ncbi:CotG/ExsB N-terminal domain-containing protein [Bacillus sp. SL00103]
MSTFDHSHIEHAVDSLRSEGRDHHLDREPESRRSHKSARSRHSNRRHWFLVEEDAVNHIAAKKL